jgi:Heavy metal associated domain 2
MSESSEGHVVHLTPRRLRVRVPAKRHNRSFFFTAQQHLSRHPGVERIEVNPATASILIHSSDSRAFLETLGRGGPFVIAEQASKQQVPLMEQARHQLAEWDKQIQQWTGSRHDTRSYIFLALLLSAAYQLIRGDIFAPAASLLWYASVVLRNWGSADRTESGQAAEGDEAKDRI